jgi:hypothetical protein
MESMEPEYLEQALREPVWRGLVLREERVRS